MGRLTVRLASDAGSTIVPASVVRLLRYCHSNEAIARSRGTGTLNLNFARWRGELVSRWPPVVASFARRPYRDGSFGVTIGAAGLAIDAAWEGATPPLWVDGEHGGFHAAEDIWSAFIEAPDATITVDGERLPGRAFPDDAWVRVMGRPLSSAHGAFSEVRVTPTP